MAGNGDAITTKFKVDISDLKKGITEANRNIKLANATFKAATSGMDMWTKSADGIRSKLDQLRSVLDSQRSKLKSYKDQLTAVKEAEQENGRRADELRTKLQQLASQGVSTTSAEYKKYQKALNDVEKEQRANKTVADELRTTILNQQGAVNGTERDIRKWSSALSDLEKEEARANSETGKLSKEIADQQSELDELKEKYKEVALAEGKNSDAAKDLASEIDGLSRDLQENRSRLQEVDSAADNLDRSLDNVEDGASQAGEGFTVMKGALANLVADGIRKAIDGLKQLATEAVTVGATFDSAMSQLAAVSGANADEIQTLTDKAKEMGSTTKFTASEAADAFNYMAMAGWKTEDMLGGIDGILNLAAASGADLATTSDIVTDALTAMGYSAGDAGHLADVMAAASSNANTNVEMMGLTFQYAAPLVGALGYNMEDTAVAIGLMANAGIKGEKAGTALRSIFTRLAAPPKECAEAMEELGISLTDTNGEMKPFSKVMEDLRKKMSKLSETEQAGTAKHIAGQEAMSGLLAIVNAAPEDFAKLTKAVDESAGSASKMSKTMMDNVGGDFTTLKSQFEGIQLQVYEKLVPALREGMKQISQALKNVNWDSFGTSAGNALNKVIDGLTWLVKNASTVGNVLKAMIAVFVVAKLNAWTTALSAAIVKMIALTTATAANTTATGAATVATNLFNAAWKANPVGLVLTGVTLLTTGIIALTKAVGENTTAADERLEQATEQLNAINEEADAYRDLKEAQYEQAQSDLANLNNVQRLKDELTSLADETGKVSEKDRARAEFILNELNTALGTEYTMTGNQIQNYKDLQTEIGKLIEAKRAEIMLQSQQEVYTKAVEKYTAAQEKSAKIAQEVAEQEKVVSDLRASIKEKEKNAAEASDARTQEMYRNQASAMQRELEKEEKTLTKKQKAYKKNEKTLQTYYADIDTYEKASALVMEGKSKEAVKLLENKNSAFKTAADVADKSAKKQKKILEQQVVDTEVNARLMKKRYEEGVEGVTEEMVKTAQDQADAAKTEFQSVGGNITKGIAKGAEKEEWTLTSTMNKLINGAVKAAEKAGLIHSPSRLFRDQVGIYIAQGIAVGIEKGSSTVTNAIQKLIKSAVTTAKSTFESSGFDKVADGVLASFSNTVDNYVKSSTKSVKLLIQQTTDQYGKQIDDQIASIKAAQKRELSQTSKMTTAQINAQVTAINKDVDKQVKAINKSVDKQVNAINKSRDKQIAAIKKDNSLTAAQKNKKIASIKEKARKQVTATKNEGKDVVKEIKANGKKEVAAVKSNGKALTEAQKAQIEKASNARIEELQKEKENYKAAGEASAAAYVEGLQNFASQAKDLVSNTMNEINAKFQEKYDKLIQSQKALQDKLTGFGELYTMNDNGTMTINSIKEQTKAITDYANDLNKIKGKVTNELFEAISQMSMEDGQKYMKKLLAMDKNDLREYDLAYNEKLKAAKKLSESIYKKDLDNLNKSYNTAVDTAMNGIMPKLVELGKQAMAGFIEGMDDSTYLDSELSKIASNIVTKFKKELGIHSPSKVFANEVGKFIPSGISVGIKNNAKSLMDSVKALTTQAVGLSQEMLSGLQAPTLETAGAGSTTTTTSVVNNFNQTINAPKQPSRIELYRQTKNLLNLKGGA